MRIVIVTGMSGSGKSTALRALEDAGFFAIDNLPIVLLDKLVELSAGGFGETHKLALVVDARGGSSALGHLPQALEAARAAGHEAELIFLDAEDAALERRFSETRRPHPLAPSDSVKAGVRRERSLLEPLRAVARTTLDTTKKSVHELKKEIQKLVSDGGSLPAMGITVMSFGFRNGLPNEADLVFDVRFLPNPFFIDHLRLMSGQDQECADYVLGRPETSAFLDRLFPMLAMLLPAYDAEGKAYLTIAIGCTGGRHRSVALSERVGRWLSEAGRDCQVKHRDLSQWRPGASTLPREVPRGSG